MIEQGGPERRRQRRGRRHSLQARAEAHSVPGDVIERGGQVMSHGQHAALHERSLGARVGRGEGKVQGMEGGIGRGPGEVGGEVGRGGGVG